MTYLNRVQFSRGAVACLADELAQAGIARPLIVTGRGVVASGLLECLRGALPDEMPAALFDEVPPNPTEAAVLAALRAYGRKTAVEVVRSAGITLG